MTASRPDPYSPATFGSDECELFAMRALKNEKLANRENENPSETQTGLALPG